MITLLNMYSYSPLTENCQGNKNKNIVFPLFKVSPAQVSWPTTFLLLSNSTKVVILGEKSFCFLPEKENYYIRAVTFSSLVTTDLTHCYGKGILLMIIFYSWPLLGFGTGKWMCAVPHFTWAWWDLRQGVPVPLCLSPQPGNYSL